jgi:hypothetical protein
MPKSTNKIPLIISMILKYLLILPKKERKALTAKALRKNGIAKTKENMVSKNIPAPTVFPILA